MLYLWICRDKIDDLKVLYEQKKLGDYSVKTFVIEQGGRLKGIGKNPWDLPSSAPKDVLCRADIHAVLAINDPFDILVDMPVIPRGMVEKVTICQLVYGKNNDNPPDGIYVYTSLAIDKKMANDSFTHDKDRRAVFVEIYSGMKLRAQTVPMAPSAHDGLAREISVCGKNLIAAKVMFRDFLHYNEIQLTAVPY